MEKLEENSYYFDGGIYDNCAVNMLLKKWGYKEITLHIISLQPLF